MRFKLGTKNLSLKVTQLHQLIRIPLLSDENGQPAASVEAKSPAGDGDSPLIKKQVLWPSPQRDKSYSGDVVPAAFRCKAQMVQKQLGHNWRSLQLSQLPSCNIYRHPCQLKQVHFQASHLVTPAIPNGWWYLHLEDGLIMKTIPGKCTWPVALEEGRTKNGTTLVVPSCHGICTC